MHHCVKTFFKVWRSKKRRQIEKFFLQEWKSAGALGQLFVYSSHIGSYFWCFCCAIKLSRVHFARGYKLKSNCWGINFAWWRAKFKPSRVDFAWLPAEFNCRGSILCGYELTSNCQKAHFCVDKNDFSKIEFKPPNGSFWEWFFYQTIKGLKTSFFKCLFSELSPF